MGAWGDSIFADDDAQDVYHHYRRLYNKGIEHHEVRRELEQAWREMIDDSDEGPIFWCAVARAQWEFGALDIDVLTKVKQIVDEGLGLDRWREGGSKLLAKREKVVREFLEKIESENPKPKKRKVEKRYPPIYEPGDCLAVELSDGTWGAVIVLATDDTHHTEGRDYVGLLDWHSVDKPSLSFFNLRRGLGSKGQKFAPPPMLMCLARFHRRAKKRIQKVGQVEQLSTDPKYTGTGRMGSWDDVITDIESHFGVK